MSAVDTPYEWIWWGHDEKDVEHTSFGRWQSHPCQLRYKLAEIQPTEHDHPSASALEASEAKIAALTAENDALREKVERMETAKLPCDVRLPPRTLIRRGVNVRTLFTAIRQREGWGDAETLFPDRAALRQEGKP